MAPDHRPLTSLSSVILMSGLFSFLWITLGRFVSRNAPMSFARSLMRLNNQSYSLFSLALALLIFNDVFHFLPILGPKSADLAYIYHLSKFYEYIDVLLLTAQGAEIGRHMRIHHLTTPFLTHFRVLNASDWQVFAFLNCVHHLLMYAYFGGASFFRILLAFSGGLQLGAGIVFDVFYCALRWGDETKERVISIVLLTVYALLFYEELSESSARNVNNAEQEFDNKEQ